MTLEDKQERALNKANAYISRETRKLGEYSNGRALGITPDAVQSCINHFNAELEVWEYLKSLVERDKSSPNNIDNK